MATILLFCGCQKQTDDEKKNTNYIDECQLFFKKKERQDKQRDKCKILNEGESKTYRQALEYKRIDRETSHKKEYADQKHGRCEHFAKCFHGKRLRNVL